MQEYGAMARLDVAWRQGSLVRRTAVRRHKGRDDYGTAVLRLDLLYIVPPCAATRGETITVLAAPWLPHRTDLV